MKLSAKEIDDIINEVEGKDPDLAKIIKNLFDCLRKEIDSVVERGKNSVGVNIEPITPRDIEPQDIFNCIGEHGNILRFPGKGENCPCAKYFVAIAFGGWQTGYGFTGAAKSANEYWLSCYNDNKGTVILTDAWDTSNFKKNYETAFNNYTSGCPTPPSKSVKHTICVIFFGQRRISIEYLN